MVDQRIAHGASPRGDFWDRILIKSVDDNAAGEGMSKAEMLTNASSLLLAGAETSATTLSGVTYLLFTHPETMQKLTDEIRTSFRSSDEIGSCSLHRRETEDTALTACLTDVYSVNSLKYMLAVLNETMRLYPAVPDLTPRHPPPGGGVVCGTWVPENVSSPLSLPASLH